MRNFCELAPNGRVSLLRATCIGILREAEEELSTLAMRSKVCLSLDLADDSDLRWALNRLSDEFCLDGDQPFTDRRSGKARYPHMWQPLEPGQVRVDKNAGRVRGGRVAKLPDVHVPGELPLLKDVRLSANPAGHWVSEADFYRTCGELRNAMAGLKGRLVALAADNKDLLEDNDRLHRRLETLELVLGIDPDHETVT